MTNQKVAYVVTTVEYSDHYIVAVFDNEKSAIEFCLEREKSKNDIKYGYFPKYRIEKYGMNDTQVNHHIFLVGVNLNGEIVEVVQPPNVKAHESGDFCNGIMWGRSSRGVDVAAKIARDYLALYKYCEEVE